MTKKLQKLIDSVRAECGQKSVLVSHTDHETTISLDMRLCDDIWGVSDKIQEIVGGCDSGAGLGFRDLQLCRLLPELK